MLTERRRSLLVFNGIGLIASAVLSGWLYFFFTLGAIDLWPFVTDVPAAIPGDRRAWNMAHLEGITNGTMLIAIGAGGAYIRLGERAQAVLIAVYDNLGKGASGAAVQNLNLMLGLDEGAGLV